MGIALRFTTVQKSANPLSRAANPQTGATEMSMDIVGFIFMLSMFFALHMVFFELDKVSIAIFTLVLIVIWFLITFKPF